MERRGCSSWRLGSWLIDRQIVEHARHADPDLKIVVRTHRWNELDAMHRLGVSEAVMGEVELAIKMSRYALRAFGADEAEVEEATRSTRARVEMSGRETIKEVNE